MKAGAEALPDDVEALKAALIAARAEAADLSDINSEQTESIRLGLVTERPGPGC